MIRVGADGEQQDVNPAIGSLTDGVARERCITAPRFSPGHDAALQCVDDGVGDGFVDGGLHRCTSEGAA